MTTGLLNGLLGMHFALIEIGLPLWLLAEPGRPTWLLPAVLLLNTVTVSLAQVPLARLVDSYRGVLRWHLVAASLIAVGCAGPLLADLVGGNEIPFVLLGFLVYSLGEVLHSSASWELSFGLADTRRIGEYQGVFASCSMIGPVLAPLVLTFLLGGLGGWGWLALAVYFAALGLAQEGFLTARPRAWNR